MVKRAVPFLLVALLGLLPAKAAGAEGACTVPGTHGTFQQALDDPSCDPIMLGAGTFDESVEVARSVEVIGAGTAATIVDGFSPFDPVIDIAEASPTTVTIRGITVTGGVSGGGFRGGGISIANAAHMVRLVDVAVNGNVGAQNGGGIYVEDGAALSMTGGSVADNQAVSTGGGIGAFDASVTLSGVDILRNTSEVEAGVSQFNGSFLAEDTTFEGNEATDGEYGAMFVAGAGDATLRNVLIRDNRAPAGAGAYLNKENVTVNDLVAEGNTAAYYAGLVVVAQVSATIENLAAINNTATGSGGGVLIFAGGETVPLRLTNATISGNRAGGSTGGMEIRTGAFVGTNLTIVNNTADSDGTGEPGDGGGLVKVDPGSATIRNSIVAGNRDGSPGKEAPDCSGPIISGGHNILGTKSGCAWIDGPADRFRVNPKLGPVADNGGGTFTHALKKGSPAIGAADPTTSPSTDQRGLDRKDPDIGAYELTFCLKVPINRIGTDGDDKLKGTNKADGIIGFGGEDILSGKGGKDGLCGGGGKDTLKGGGGVDRMKGQGGKDRCIGGGGSDAAVCENERSI